MYIVSDVVDMGEAHALILADIKQISIQDDSAQLTMEALEYFDE